MLRSDLLVIQWIDKWLVTKKSNDVLWAFHCLYRNMSATRDRQWENYAKDAERYLMQKAKRREHDLVRELQQTIEYNAKMETIILTAWNSAKNELTDDAPNSSTALAIVAGDAVRLTTGFLKLDHALQSAQMRHQASAIQNINVNSVQTGCKCLLAFRLLRRTIRAMEKDRLIYCLSALKTHKSPSQSARLRSCGSGFTLVSDDGSVRTPAVLLRRDQNRFPQAQEPATPRALRVSGLRQGTPETQTVWCIPSTRPYQGHFVSNESLYMSAGPTTLSPKVEPQRPPPSCNSLFAAAAARRAGLTANHAMHTVPRLAHHKDPSLLETVAAASFSPAGTLRDWVAQQTTPENWIAQAQRVTRRQQDDLLMASKASGASVRIGPSTATDYQSPNRGAVYHERMPSNIPSAPRQSRSVSPSPRLLPGTLEAVSPQLFSRGTNRGWAEANFAMGRNRHTISMR